MNWYLLGRKEMAKMRKQDGNDADAPTNDNMANRVCRVWDILIGLTRDMVTGPPTSLDDCLGYFFDTSDLSGM